MRPRVEYAIAWSLLAALEHLPERLAYGVARACTRLLDLAMPRLRRVAMTNLEFAFPAMPSRKREEIVDGVFDSLARLMVAIARFPRLNPSNIRSVIDYEGLENYLAAKQEGRGILIATAHLGNWELSAFAHAIMTEPMHVMVRRLDNPAVDGLIERRRTLSGNRLIDKRDAARGVIQALRANEAVGILIDQNTSGPEGVFVNFFGKPAAASSVFVKFAHRTQAPVIPGFAFWDAQRKRYVLRFYPRIPMTGDAVADTERIHTIFESIIREHPDQWMWIHRRWKTRPPGEPALY